MVVVIDERVITQCPKRERKQGSRRTVRDGWEGKYSGRYWSAGRQGTLIKLRVKKRVLPKGPVRFDLVREVLF